MPSAPRLSPSQILLRPRAPQRCGAARLAVALVALAACCAARADPQVFFLRGWFGVFSTGMDRMAGALRDRGIPAEAVGHLAWRSTVDRILEARAKGSPGPIVLVGHSQGGNNIIDMARELEKHSVRVDLLVTLAPFLQDPVPANVARAINYYQSPGWGTPLAPDPDFKGELVNVDVGDAGTFHVNIDKNRRIQAEIVAAIVALVKPP